MKRILLTQRLVREPGTGEVRDALDVQWARLLSAAGLLPVPLPSLADLEAFVEETRPQGLIFTGGNDLSVVSDDPLSRQRDELEARVLAQARKRHWPVLGVCRGMQVLCVDRGMRLERVEGHAGSRHALQVVDGSRFLRGHRGTVVSSYHNYAPTGHCLELRVAARAEDGTVEAMEDPMLHTLGIGWHPEREPEFTAADLGMLRALFHGESLS